MVQVDLRTNLGIIAGSMVVHCYYYMLVLQATGGVALLPHSSRVSSAYCLGGTYMGISSGSSGLFLPSELFPNIYFSGSQCHIRPFLSNVPISNSPRLPNIIIILLLSCKRFFHHWLQVIIFRALTIRNVNGINITSPC